MKISVWLVFVFVMAIVHSFPVNAGDNFVQIKNKTPASESVTVLPLVALLANPEKYNGKEVQTYGFLTYSHHNAVLYLSSNDAFNFGQLNGIAVSKLDSGCSVRQRGTGINPSADKLKGLEDCDHRYVELEGIFSSRGMLFPMRCPAGLIEVREVIYNERKIKFR